MLYIFLFVLELVILFFLSKRVQRSMGFALLRLTGNKKITVYFMSVLFLPGTFVHEVSHFLAALFLLVPVGNLELIPKIEENNIKLGSVSIAKTDPVRRFLIGAAPFYIGTAILLFSMYYIMLAGNGLHIQNIADLGFWQVTSLIYLIFTITNTMFSSKKDMEGMWGFLAILFLVAVTLWIFNIKPNFNYLDSPEISDFFQTASLLLLPLLVLDIIAITVLPKK